MTNKMTEYTPDNWVVLKLTNNEDISYKVLSGWNTLIWRMNSSIVGVQRYYHKEKSISLTGFYGQRGSITWCHSDRYGLRMNNAHAYESLKKEFGNDIEMMPKNTNWIGLV